LAVIDHQDARRGPDTYDRVSLLLDPYVELSAGQVKRLIDLFLERTGSREPAAFFRRRFHLMAAQRTLKAAGTFAAQKMLRGNDTYIRYLPRALALAGENLSKCSQFATLHETLAPFLTPPGS
ncbi:MAG: hypothetical protein ACE5ID_10380, partial [Acidobacteriota bacterium]